MKRYLDGLSDEILEDIVCEYGEIDKIDVDKIISDLKSNLSDYLYYDPEEPKHDFDYKDDFDMSIEQIEKLEPKDNICG